MNKKLICELCGTQKKRTKDLVCHHIIPIKKDGTNVELLMSVENILVICQECNELMQGKPVFNRMSGIENKLYNFSKLEPHYNREQAKRISKQYKL
jgi:5-methylcytosine-specific restriction endonuclease McrA